MLNQVKWATIWFDATKGKIDRIVIGFENEHSQKVIKNKF